MKKKLHELIEMANLGKIFTATVVTVKPNIWLTEEIFKFSSEKITHWSSTEVTADWTVRMKREPRVVWLSLYDDASFKGQVFKTEKDAAFQGKPIKFIEVIENET